MPNTAVICVNYRGTSDTVACVKSLLQSKVQVQVVVVDTTPHDPALQAGLTFAPDIVLLRAPENVGFGRGNNIGIDWVLEHEACEFLFLLNNDAVILPESIERLQEAMAEHPDVGIVAPRIAYLDAPAKLWYGGGEIDWRRASAYTPGFNGDVRAPLATTERDVTFASGCALFMRRSVAQKLGGFDARFFMYEEDVEFCLRATQAGIRIRYVPGSLILHRGQGSDPNAARGTQNLWSAENVNLPFFVFHMIRNRLLNIYLHARGSSLLTAMLFFPLFMARRVVPLIWAGRTDALAATYRGMVGFWRVKRTGRSPD